MAIKHKIDEKRGFVLSTLVGAISDDDLIAAYRELYEDQRWKPGYKEVVDLRRAEMEGVTGEGLRRLSALVEHYVPKRSDQFKTALVASDELPFGLGRMYEAISAESPENAMVFKKLDQALDWIGIDPSLLD
jgi:hypothetical protein